MTDPEDFTVIDQAELIIIREQQDLIRDRQREIDNELIRRGAGGVANVRRGGIPPVITWEWPSDDPKVDAILAELQTWIASGVQPALVVEGLNGEYRLTVDGALAWLRHASLGDLATVEEMLGGLDDPQLAEVMRAYIAKRRGEVV